MNTRKVLVYVLSGLFILFVLTYAYSRSQTFLEGPSIEVTSPENGSVLDNPFVTIKGIAHNISRIKLSGKQIFVDQDGVFEEKLLVQQGHTIILFEAEDKFNRSVSETLEFFYGGKEGAQSNSTTTADIVEDEVNNTNLIE